MQAARQVEERAILHPAVRTLGEEEQAVVVEAARGAAAYVAFRGRLPGGARLALLAPWRA